MNVKLAEALLIRKELQKKVDQIGSIKDRDLFEVKARRQRVEDGIDDVVAQVPKLTLSQVTREYDYCAKRLRMVDSAIQQANWRTVIDVGDIVTTDFYEAQAKVEAQAKIEATA
jgi:hypothetical protein